MIQIAIDIQNRQLSQQRVLLDLFISHSAALYFLTFLALPFLRFAVAVVIVAAAVAKSA
jgi:hypothetical protein